MLVRDALNLTHSVQYAKTVLVLLHPYDGRAMEAGRAGEGHKVLVLYGHGFPYAERGTRRVRGTSSRPRYRYGTKPVNFRGCYTYEQPRIFRTAAAAKSEYVRGEIVSLNCLKPQMLDQNRESP